MVIISEKDKNKLVIDGDDCNDLIRCNFVFRVLIVFGFCFWLVKKIIVFFWLVSYWWFSFLVLSKDKINLEVRFFCGWWKIW